MATAAVLTVEQFAEAVQLPRSTAYRRVAAGQVVVSNIGSPKRPRWRIRAAEVDEYLRRTQVKTRRTRAT